MNDKSPKGIVRQINKTKIKVKSLLETSSDKMIDYRDNDEILVARIWADEFIALGNDIKKSTARDLLKAYAVGSLTSAEYIVRARRRLQEMYPELRGTRWNERHGLGNDLKNNIDSI